MFNRGRVCFTLVQGMFSRVGYVLRGVGYGMFNRGWICYTNAVYV